MTDIDVQAGTVDTASAFIALQPVCDGQFRHMGDALLYRHSARANRAEILDPQHATISTVTTAVYDIGVSNLVGDRDLYIKAPASWLSRPELVPEPEPQMVLEINQSELGKLPSLHALKEKGYRLCLFCDDWPPEAPWALFSSVKISAAHVDKSAGAIESMRRVNPQCLAIAHRVHDRQLFAQSKAAGFERFQGFFYAQPTTLSRPGLTGSGQGPTLVRLLAEVFEPEPDTDHLLALMTQVPKVTLSLLRRANSSGVAGIRRISSVSEAVARLGLRDIRILISSLVVLESGDAAGLLLPDILTRAAFCRQLAEADPRLDADVGFTLGLMSLLPDALNLSIEDLLSQLSLADPLEKALLGRTGDYGPLLKLVEAYENGGIKPGNSALIERLTRELLVARQWTEQMLTLI